MKSEMSEFLTSWGWVKWEGTLWIKDKVVMNYKLAFWKELSDKMRELEDVNGELAQLKYEEGV